MTLTGKQANALADFADTDSGWVRIQPSPEEGAITASRDDGVTVRISQDGTITNLS